VLDPSSAADGERCGDFLKDTALVKNNQSKAVRTVCSSFGIQKRLALKRPDDMKEINITIRNEVGLHARPATLLVKNAKQFKSKILLSANGHVADAKSILSILVLGVCRGMNVTVRAEGEDEADAIQVLKDLIESNFGEPE
jgi:phosphocarrier protein